MDIKNMYWKKFVCMVAFLIIDFGCPELPWMIEECTIGVSSVNAETYLVGTPDINNSYTEDGILKNGGNYCYFGLYLDKYYDAYFNFAIPDSVYNAVIDSVRIKAYINKSNGTVYIHGINVEDCPDAETGDPDSWSRSTTSIEWTGEFPTNWYWTPLVTVLFNEWVSSYSHAGTDHFGIMIDDNNVTRSWIADYEYNSSENNCCIYVYYHHPEEINARNVLWSNGARSSLWSEGSSSVFEEQ